MSRSAAAYGVESVVPSGPGNGGADVHVQASLAGGDDLGEATYADRVKIGDELVFGGRPALPCAGRHDVRGGGRVAVRPARAGRGGVDRAESPVRARPSSRPIRSVGCADARPRGGFGERRGSRSAA